jgi:hypothetical protein
VPCMLQKNVSSDELSLFFRLRGERKGKKKAYSRASALLRGFDGPGVFGPSVFTEYVVVNVSVDIFRVDQRAVHVEDAGLDWRQARSRHSWGLSRSEIKLEPFFLLSSGVVAMLRHVHRLRQVPLHSTPQALNQARDNSPRTS